MGVWSGREGGVALLETRVLMTWMTASSLGEGQVMWAGSMAIRTSRLSRACLSPPTNAADSWDIRKVILSRGWWGRWEEGGRGKGGGGRRREGGRREGVRERGMGEEGREGGRGEGWERKGEREEGEREGGRDREGGRGED